MKYILLGFLLLSQVSWAYEPQWVTVADDSGKNIANVDYNSIKVYGNGIKIGFIKDEKFGYILVAGDCARKKIMFFPLTKDLKIIPFYIPGEGTLSKAILNLICK